MAREISAFKLRTELTVENSKFSAGMKASEKDVDRLGTRFTKLGPEISKALKGHETGTRFGKEFSSSATALITGSFKDLGQTLGSVLGTVMLPGIGTAIGSAFGSGVDKLVSGISGPIMATITAGIELNKILESTRVEFTSYAGSEKEAVKYLDELLTLSKQTGVLPANLIEASESLYDFTGNLKLTNIILRASIDQAADIGGGAVKIREIADALGLIAEKGDLSAQSLKKLYKLKVNAPELLAQATGLTPAQIKKLMEQGRIRGDIAAQVIAEGLQRKNAGFAKKLASTTTQGAEDVFAAQKTILGAQGTVNITQEYKRILQQASAIMASPQAEKFVQFLNTTAGSVIGMLERGVAAGVNVTGGLAKGIETGAPGVMNAITNLGTSAIDTLGDVWGMKSPSRVFAAMGANAVEGLENGLVDRTSQGFDRWAEALEKAGGEAFIRGVAGIAKRIGVDPAWLLNVMAFESGFNPKAANPGSSGRGLIQFMNPTARGLGFKSSNQIAGLSAMQQLQPVEQYLRPFAGKMHSQGDVYATVAAGRLPGASGVLFRAGSKEYAANKVWDANRDGLITADEIGELASRKGGFTSPLSSPDANARAASQAMDAAARASLMANGRPITDSAPMPVSIVRSVIGTTTAAAKIATATAGGDPVKVVESVTGAVNEMAGSMPPLSSETTLATGALGFAATGMADLGEATVELTKITEESQAALRRILIEGVDTLGTLSSMIGQAASFLPQQQVGKKRGFFSKLLGFAAPFLSLIPGVGPILSTVAGMASNAIGGNWAGVATGLAGGLAPGGVFRSSGSGSGSSAVGGGLGTAAAGIPGRALGGRVLRGNRYIVGEQRPELFEPDQDGWIHPRVSARFGGGDAITAQLVAALDRHNTALERQNTFLARLESTRPHDVVRMGARGYIDALDQDAGLIRMHGQRLRLP